MLFEFTLNSSLSSLQPNLFPKWIYHEWNYSMERNNSAGPIINFSFLHSLITLLYLPKASSENDTKLPVFAPLNMSCSPLPFCKVRMSDGLKLKSPYCTLATQADGHNCQISLEHYGYLHTFTGTHAKKVSILISTGTFTKVITRSKGRNKVITSKSLSSNTCRYQSQSLWQRVSADTWSVSLWGCVPDCHQLLLSGETQYQSKPELLPG